MSCFKTWWFRKVIPCIFLGLAFIGVGYCVGWLVGASRAAAVTTLIPLIVGLLGAVTYGLVDRKSMLQKMLDSVKDLEAEATLKPGSLQAVKDKLGDESDASFWTPALWSLGVVAFSVTCLFGAIHGAVGRDPVQSPLVYEPLENLLKEASLTPDDWNSAYNLYWHLRENRVPPGEMEGYFQHCIVPLIKEKRFVLKDKEGNLTTAPGVKGTQDSLSKFSELKYKSGESTPKVEGHGGVQILPP